MTSLAGGTKLVTIATQTTDASEPFSSADLSALAAAESLYDDNLSSFYHGSWPITDSGTPGWDDMMVTLTMSVGLGRVFKILCLSVCLSVCPQNN